MIRPDIHIDLPGNTVPYARQAIADIVAGRRLGLFGWPARSPDADRG